VSFTRPAVLFALLIPALLFYWVWTRSGREVALPFDHSGHQSGAGWGRLLNVAESLPALILSLALVILAGPQETSEPKTKRALTNIEFCVDISCSMNAAFDNGTRYDASMEAISSFLDQRPTDAFGLTFFGNSVLHWVPLSSDTSAIRCAAPFMKPDRVPPWFGGTEIGKALVACKGVLTQREEGDRMIILVSDGFSWDLNNGRDEEIARMMRENNIVVNAIHIADSEIPGTIVNITSLTGGDVYNPGDAEHLKTVFKKIDEMQETKLEKASAESRDYFFPFCVAALSILGAFLLSLFGLRFTPW
jgi:Ca-activated chloride channel homolog